MSTSLASEKRIKNIDRVEKYIDIDENLIAYEKDHNLIRMDMNIVEYPIFSKTKERKKNQIVKYYFKSDKSSSIEVEPAEGYCIPGEFEERVFIALTKIMRDNDYGQSFYVSINEIYKALNCPRTSNIYSKIRSALKTMTNNFYRFENTLYSNEINSLLEQTIETNIMNIVEITRKDKESTNIDYFDDGRVKSIYRISLTDHFYNNIIKKGYMVFDSTKLLEISNSTTRNIYTLLEKWRRYELYIKRPAFFIARRIPLAWDKRSIDRTVKRIGKSLDELKNKNLISSYNLIRNGKWEKAEVEVFYSEDHNKSKSKDFNVEKSSFAQDIHIALTETRASLQLDVNEEYNAIIELFPPKARRYKTLPQLILDSLKKYEYDYIKYTAEYTAINCKRAYLTYFRDALENNWAEEYIEKKKTKLKAFELKKEENLKDKFEEKQMELQEEEVVYGKTDSDYREYLQLDEKNQEEIKEEAYKLFLEESGLNHTSTNKKIFSNPSISKQYIRKAYTEYLAGKEDVAELVAEEPVKTEVTERGYPSISAFSIEILKVFREKEIEINPQDFMTVFSIMKEYEDDFIKVNFDEETKIGKIELK